MNVLYEHVTASSSSSSTLSLPNQAVAQLWGHDGPIECVTFTADGKYCLTGGHDRTVRLWNPSRIDPAFNHAVTTTAISATTRQGLSSTVITNPHQHHHHHHPRGLRRLPPTADDSSPALSLPHALPIQTYQDGHTHAISALAVDGKSTTLVAGSDKTLVVTDVVTQQVKRRFQGHVGRINAVAISAPGCETYLSASYDATVRIWDGRSHSSYEPIQIFKEAKDSVTSVHVVQEFDDDGNDDNDNNHDYSKKNQHRKTKNNNNNNNTAIIRTASVDGVVRSYDIRKGLVTCDDCHGAAITSMTPTRDGECLVISGLDGIIRLMECHSGTLLNTYLSSDDDHQNHTHHHHHHVAGNYGLQCCCTADDATIVSGSEDGRAVLYDLVRGTVVQCLQGHTRPTCAVAAHPKESSVVLTASFDGTAVVWANRHVPYFQSMSSSS